MARTVGQQRQARLWFARIGVFCLAFSGAPAVAQTQISASVPDEFPHVSFGAPARVATTRVDTALGATIVTFTTGARLIVKSTRSAPGQVVVIASFGAGRSGVPDHLVHALWATTLMPLGGTTKLSYADLDQWQKTSGHPVNVTFVAGVSAFQLQGDAPSSDLRTELALLTAYARDPGFGPEMSEKIAMVGPMIATQIEGDPAAEFARAVQHVMVGLRYQELPGRADIAATTGKELPELLRASLAMAPDVAVVGDISVEDAIWATADTLAAGDLRPTGRWVRASVMPPPPRREPIIVEHRRAEGDGWFGEYWRLPDEVRKPRLSAVAEVAAAVVQDRLQREAKLNSSPATQPVVSASVPIELAGGAAFGIAIKIPPSAVTATRNRITCIVGELARGSIESELFKRARLAVIASRVAEQSSNAWAARQLTLVLRAPGMTQVIPQESDVTSITPAAVSRFLKTYLLGQRPRVITAFPEVRVAIAYVSNPPGRKP
ncbi:hypothetical protein AQZ49_08390 [Novosphingobium sp. FSW06-99]|nr:hypothetical protein AQZ49_08390 [Novosphingobium sp. FSW06-99]